MASLRPAGYIPAAEGQTGQCWLGECPLLNRAALEAADAYNRLAILGNAALKAAVISPVVASLFSTVAPHEGIRQTSEVGGTTGSRN